MTIIENIGLILLGIVLSAVGYFVKRKIEHKPLLESLDKHKKLLDIHRQMNEQGIGLEGLKELEAKLHGKESAIQTRNALLQSESIPLISESETKDLTQHDLNERASRNLEKAKQKMQAAIAGLDSRVGDSQSQFMMNSQNEWERYSVSQAEAAASRYEGGSIYPLIYLSELEALTNERTARLQTELDDYIQLGN